MSFYIFFLNHFFIYQIFIFLYLFLKNLLSFLLNFFVECDVIFVRFSQSIEQFKYRLQILFHIKNIDHLLNFLGFEISGKSLEFNLLCISMFKLPIFSFNEFLDSFVDVAIVKHDIYQLVITID